MAPSISKQKPMMEEIIWRFPHIGNNIFKRLSNKSLIKCKKVARTWEYFFINEKFYKIKLKYETKQKGQDEYGKTPLHQAAESGNLEECKSIMDHVEVKNPPNRFGFTPLHFAANEGHLSICQLIIENKVSYCYTE